MNRHERMKNLQMPFVPQQGVPLIDPAMRQQMEQAAMMEQVYNLRINLASQFAIKLIERHDEYRTRESLMREAVHLAEDLMAALSEGPLGIPKIVEKPKDNPT